MRQFAAYIRARAAFKLFMFDGTLCIFAALCIIPYLMYYNSYSNSFKGVLTAVFGARTQESGERGQLCNRVGTAPPPSFHGRLFFLFFCSYNSYQCDINYEDVRQQL